MSPNVLINGLQVAFGSFFNLRKDNLQPNVEDMCIKPKCKCKVDSSVSDPHICVLSMNNA